MNEPERDKRLSDYLLGQLPEAEEGRLEQEYLADAELQERLLLIEDDLVDAYAHGELGGGERRHLEQGLLASPRGRRKLELARGLMAAAPRSRWSWRPAALAAGIALVLALILLIRKGDDRVVAMVLEPGLTRDVGALPVLTLPPGTARAHLQLDLTDDRHDSYRVSLLGNAGEVTWSSRGAKSQGAITVEVPAALLAPGQQLVLVSAEDQPDRPLAQYAFVVRRQ
jgi:hypothetical protein